MKDEKYWHPEFFAFSMFVMAILFSIVGIFKLIGFEWAELGFFNTTITSRSGTIIWIICSVLSAILFGYIFHRTLKKNN